MPGMIAHLALGWFALVLFAGAYTPVGISASVLLGSFDATHEVQFHGDPGGLQLVLHHGSKCQAPHHSPAAQVLTLFTQPQTSTEQDHVILFGSQAISAAKGQGTLPKTGTLPPSIAEFINPDPPNPGPVNSLSDIGYSASNTQLSFLRTTLLQL
jgi:hypothetical protein